MTTMFADDTLTSRRVPQLLAASRGPRSRRLPFLVAAFAVAGTVALLGLHLMGGGVPGAASSDSRAFSPATGGPAINPLLILQPRTIVQVVRVRDVRLTLVARPLLPGLNHLTVLAVGPRGPLGGGRVQIRATMLGMAMRPSAFVARESRAGRYDASATLPMFGQWRLSVRLTPPGRAGTLASSFTVGVDLPPALLRATAESRAGR